MSSSDQAGRLALLSDLIRDWLKNHNDHFIVGPSNRILGYCTEEGSRLSMFFWGGVLINDDENLVISRAPGVQLRAADPEFFTKLDNAIQQWHKKYGPSCPQERKWHN